MGSASRYALPWGRGMTRRALLVLGAIAGATVACLAFLPMTANALVSVAIWLGSVAFVVIVASAFSAALDRRDRRVLVNEMWREARRALR